jgi:hypothetical protein
LAFSTGGAVPFETDMRACPWLFHCFIRTAELSGFAALKPAGPIILKELVYSGALQDLSEIRPRKAGGTMSVETPLKMPAPGALI